MSTGQPMSLLALLAMTAASSAAPITYTETVNGVGSLNGVAFNGAFTLSATADTVNITSPRAAVYEIAAAVTVTVPAVGSGVFTDNMCVIASQPVTSYAGFYDNSAPVTLVTDVPISGFATYDLTGSIGPILGGAGCFPNHPFPTTDGTFIYSSIMNSTFQAGPPTPEPASTALIGVAVAWLLLRHPRRLDASSSPVNR